ncbi:SRPBCC family protein [Alteromonas sp. BL110]|uniref:SRPBCC family protein n=1 Tax=Alteromonas sp. BL110 TaxID=1714845 RepID=UPI000E4778D9|nr:SRPBCC family protein [Alteromonas sp. BL110]AXT39394.1 SRPBCC family protein [Alteromonas sp. BL110]RKM82120.1 SRPBCC family protein [Alteromonas sp. BL110]
MVNVHYQRIINATPQVLRDTLLDHQNLSDFFNASFKVLKDENDGEVSGGVGCVREVSILGVRFKEEIVKADTSGIDYRVVDDFPVHAHRGSIRFSAQGSLTKVFYRISCCAPWYMPNWLLTRMLQNDIEQCLDKLGARFDTH